MGDELEGVGSGFVFGAGESEGGVVGGPVHLEGSVKDVFEEDSVFVGSHSG